MPIDGYGIQKRVYRGYGIAGAKTGFPHDQFRPSDGTPPLSTINRIATLPASLDARPSYKFGTPALHQDAERYALVDGSVIEVGDYLVGPTETVFVAAKPMLQPIVCIACNETISLRRHGAGRGFGAIEDRSDANAYEASVFTEWPVSMLFGGRGRAGTGDIPGDQSDPDFMILMPAVPNIPEPQSGDIVVDDEGRRFAVGWWEASSLGWRMLARLLTAG